MNIQVQKLCSHIKKRRNSLETILSPRIHTIINDFEYGELINCKSNEVDLFDLIVRFILHADKEPAALIADLLAILDPDKICHLNESTIPKSGAFLRDSLRGEQVQRMLVIADKSSN